VKKEIDNDLGVPGAIGLDGMVILFLFCSFGLDFGRMASRVMAGFVGIGGIGAVRSKATMCSADGICFQNIGLGSVSLSWPASGSRAYRVAYKSDSNPASFRTVTRSSVILKGLSPGSSYDMSISELDSKKLLSRASFTTMSALRQ